MQAVAARAASAPLADGATQEFYAAMLRDAVLGQSAPDAATAAAVLQAAQRVSSAGTLGNASAVALLRALSPLQAVAGVDLSPTLCAVGDGLLRDQPQWSLFGVRADNLTLLARRALPEDLQGQPWTLATGTQAIGALTLTDAFTATVLAAVPDDPVDYVARATSPPVWAKSRGTLALQVAQNGSALDPDLSAAPLSAQLIVPTPGTNAGLRVLYRAPCDSGAWSGDVAAVTAVTAPNYDAAYTSTRLGQWAITADVYVSQVSGCTDFAPSTNNCPTAGTTTLTITGDQFGSAGARVYFGPNQEVPCLDVVHVPGSEKTQLWCRQYPSTLPATYDVSPGASARTLPVTVVTTFGWNTTAWKVTMAYAKRPIITALFGCPLAVNATATAQCPTAGGLPVTLLGANFIGLGGPTLRFGPYPCRCSALAVVNSTMLVCGAYPGVGQSQPVTLTVGSESTSPPGVALSYRPRPAIASISGCDQSTATTQLALTGCSPGGQPFVLRGTDFGGPGAAVTVTIGGQPCTSLTHTTTTVTCAAYRGNGTLQAVALVVDGEAAQESVTISFTSTCPSPGGSVCSGHGICTEALGTCTCATSAALGYWSTPNCSSCLAGFYGASCSSPCPGGYANPCSGHGSCADGVTGIGTCTCAANYAGVDCSVACPVTAEGVCSGHGTCSSGATGTGQCSCAGSASAGYWAGAACQQCLTSYFGADCTQACPGYPANVCSNRGVCRSGRTGDGGCNCSAGFAGLNCSIYCPGNGACNGHGTCDALLGLCTCYSSPSAGYWDGADCANCLAGWSGTGTCTLPCPRNASNVVCSGRGTCREGLCYCDGSACGPSCNQTANCLAECSAGYWGPTCAQQCPGSPACSGHGTCSDGRAGTGLCACQAGYALADCSARCPGAPPCSAPGGGSCNATTGLCNCASGYALANCSLPCPGGAATPCNGHGTCNAGRAGDGTCQCNPGYWGAACAACPGVAAQLGICYGHGACQADGTCLCTDDATGHWGGADNVTCSSCRTGWTGANCTARCPRSAAGIPCAGHGACTADTGVCQCTQSVIDGFWAGDTCDRCAAGYWGANCTQQCAGGACLPCTAHGDCRDGTAGTGQCTCYSNVTFGFWNSTDCSVCQAGYWGSNCLWSCLGGSAAPCSGHGTCSDGVHGTGTCTCASGPGYWDGATCSTCKAGYAGANCSVACQGLLSDGTVCSGHGVCSSGVTGTGTCTCASGYYGATCALQCPLSTAGVVCSGHGTCSDGASGTGLCTCYSSAATGYWQGSTCADCQPTYAGSTCTARCPGAPALICGGQGTCNDGLARDGSCACYTGWAGAGCTLPCPGLAVGLVCNLRGTCDAVTAACQCYATATLGYWAGPNCTAC
eukprot:EG_transcript_627